MAIIVSKGGKDARKIEKSDFEAEDYLQQYVYDNPESIPLYDIKEDIRLLIVCREFPTKSGPIDVLGFDREGDIYCVETKLYKNPDKRLVVAQVLDYGASLWHSYPDFGDFTANIDKYIAKKTGGSLLQRIKEFFGIGDEEAASLLDNVRSNLSNGRFKFVVLMDKLHDQLKDLVVFLNENSRFDIYAVEMEFYRNGEQEILIPKLFGAQVKKEVPGSQTESSRRKWNEASFFEDAERVLDSQSVTAVRTLYDFSRKKGASIGWGTGTTRGSYSPRFKEIAQRSVFSVFSDGTLTLNFGWLNDTKEAEGRRDQLAEYLRHVPGISIPSNYREIGVSSEPEKWCPNVNALIESIEKLLDGTIHP
jgi:hypothetical protein